MNWDDLRYVLALSRNPTLSGAATGLGVTRTTVGRRVRSMERRLGVRLFDRTPDGLLLTAAGHDMREAAERLETEVLSVEGRLLGRDAQLQGKLRVSTMDVIFLGFHQAFSSFSERYPNIELTVTASTERVSLTRREADVAIRMSNSPTEYLVGRKVGRIHFAVYGNAALVQRIGPDAPLSEYPWLHWDERTNPRFMDLWMARNAPNAQVVMRVDCMMALREAIAAGIGVQLLACFDGDNDSRVSRIGAIDPDGRDLWLLTLAELRNTRRIRAFMDHMDHALRARSEDMAGR